MGVNMSNFTAGEGAPVLNIQGIENPTVPISVSEQIESTRKSYDAGAS